MTGANSETGYNNSVFSPKEIVIRYLHYVPWVVLSVAIFLILAYLKIRYTTPIYNVTAKLQVKNPAAYGKGSEKFDDIFMMQGTSRNLSDEIELIKSRSMAMRVVKSLGMQVQVYNKGSIRTSLVYQRDIPFDINFYQLKDSSASFSFLITLLDDNQFKLNQEQEPRHFGEIVEMNFGKVMLTRNKRPLWVFASNEFLVSWQSVNSRASALKSALNAAQANDFSSVLTLTFQTENTKTGIDVLNQYMEEFQKASLEDKREIAVNTLLFIDEQLDTVRQQLGGAERNLQLYREKNRVFAPEQQSNISFQEVSESARQLTEQEVKLKVVDYLHKYISDKSNPYRMVPATLGIEEPSLLQQISEYNKLQLERETALKSIGAGNSIIRNMETTIESLRGDMLENLRNIRQTYLLAIQNLDKKLNEAQAEIKTIPQKEKQLLEVTRQQNILQELYSYLLQKKLETSIASASTISNIRIIESAVASASPISPNKKSLYTIALLLGIGVPVGIIFVVEYLNDKVKTRSDIEKFSSVPILGEVGHADDAGTLVVTANNRKFIAEQFRIIRSNLKYIVPKVDKPVLMVTSSFSGEGKSFISTNIGAVMAISGKKTVILEFDIRKPKILKGLGLNERKGITNYIVGNMRLEDIVHRVPGVDNLFVIPCGPVPPNPAEMLLDPKVQEMINDLRLMFEVVIIDTAPIGLVSDSITLGQHVDATIYIVRHNYTLKKHLKLVDELYTEQKLPHLSVIINDIQQRAGYYGYYGYGGYGYGYGYGSDYFEKSSGKSKGWLRWFSRK